MDDHTRRPVKPQTLVAQGFGVADPLANGLVNPIHLSTTYLRDPDNGYSNGHIYGRADNPTLHQAEALIAALEGAREVFVFGSGMAAASAVFLALDRPTQYHRVARDVLGTAVLAAGHRPVWSLHFLCRYVVYRSHS